MAADTEFTGVYRLYRQTRSGDRVLLVGDTLNTYLDQTTIANQLFINGGAPTNNARTIFANAPQHVLGPGEFLVMQGKFTNAANNFDSTGGASELIYIQIASRDLNTGTLAYKTIRDTDRDTTILADDPATVQNKYADVMVWKVPDGEKWQLFGEWHVRSSTTA